MQFILIILIVAAIIIIIAIILLWKFYFLRNPAPVIPKRKNFILSPASGTVARIYNYKNSRTQTTKTAETQTIEKGFFSMVPLITKDVAKNGHIILIRLHVYNVHWQRSPIAGTIKNVTYSKGKFLNAVKDAKNMQCFFENEKNEILINGKIRCKVVQIAGFLARRIECFVKKGGNVNSGDVIGMINLGSQCALITPKIRIMAKEGDVVHAGETIIGEMA